MLDAVSRMIPFIANDDCTRVQMASNQMSQAVTLIEPEVPFIRTGYEEEFLEETSYLYKAIDDGIVLYRDEKLLIVKYDQPENEGQIIDLGGEVKNIDGFDRCLHSNFISNQTFKKGDILARANTIHKDGFLSLGRNLNTCFISHPYAYKDAIPISETCAEKMKIKYIYEEILEFEDTIPTIWYNNEGISYPQGTYVEKAQEIFFVKNRNPLYIQNVVDPGQPIKAKASGKLYYNLIIDEIVKTRNEQDYYEDEYNNRIEKEKEISNYIDIAFGENTLKADAYKRFYCPQQFIKRSGKSIILKYWIVQEVPVMKGCKLSNRHGNKGVVSIILPDKEMPMSESGIHADIITTPLSVVSRMNVGQLEECHMNAAMKRVFKQASQMNTLEERKNHIAGFLDCVQEPILNDLFRKSFNQDVWNLMERDQGFQIIQRPFKSCSFDNLFRGCKYAGMDDDLKEIVTLADGSKHRGVFGTVYFTRLQHESYKKLWGRSTGEYSSVGQPSKGTNAHRIGEMELHSLLGYQIPNLLMELIIPKSDNLSECARLLQSLHDQTQATYQPLNRSVGSFNLMKLYLEAAGYSIKTDNTDLILALKGSLEEEIEEEIQKENTMNISIMQND